MINKWYWRVRVAIYGASLGCFMSAILDGDMTYTQTAIILFTAVIFTILATWQMKGVADGDWR